MGIWQHCLLLLSDCVFGELFVSIEREIVNFVWSVSRFQFDKSLVPNSFKTVLAQKNNNVFLIARII